MRTLLALALLLPAGVAGAQTLLHQDVTDGTAQGGLAALAKPVGVRGLAMGASSLGNGAEPSAVLSEPAGLSRLSSVNVVAGWQLMDFDAHTMSAFGLFPMGTITLGMGGSLSTVTRGLSPFDSNLSAQVAVGASYMSQKDNLGQITNQMVAAKYNVSYGVSLKYAVDSFGGVVSHAFLADAGLIVPLAGFLYIGVNLWDIGILLAGNRDPVLHLPKSSLSVAYASADGSTRVGLILYKDFMDSGADVEVRLSGDIEIWDVEAEAPLPGINELDGGAPDPMHAIDNAGQPAATNSLGAPLPVDALSLRLLFDLAIPKVSLSLGLEFLARPLIFGVAVRLPVLAPGNPELSTSIGFTL